MTLAIVLRTLRTRWYVVASGLVLTLVAVLLLSARGGVYTTSVDVQLIPPERVGVTRSPSPFTSLVSLAGMVEREVGDDVHRTEPVSPEATLAGLGVKRGTLVTLPNTGGQWNYFFDAAVLRVQAVATTRAEATRRRDDAVREIEATLRRVQIADAVPRLGRVTVRLVPRMAPVSNERGSEARAALAAGLLGMALTVVGAVRFDRVSRDRDRATGPSVAPGPVIRSVPAAVRRIRAFAGSRSAAQVQMNGGDRCF